MERIETRIKSRAQDLGFSLCGICPAADADRFDQFRDWLARGYHGEMAYLKDYEHERRHPRGVLESVRSVVIVALEYAPSSPNSEFRTTNSGRVAAYAR